jgi:hypothetical protein
MISRRAFIAEMAGVAGLGALAHPLLALSPGPLITVYKTASCHCCAGWVEHLHLNGFRTEVHDLDSVEPIKDRYGVPQPLRSCHTGLVDGYLLEGHVPADDIQRLLTERPRVAGLAVPGMPVSAPGMYRPGDSKVPYEVLAFQKSGATTTYSKH